MIREAESGGGRKLPVRSYFFCVSVCFQVEVRRAIPREEARDHQTAPSDKENARLFVGGISDDVTDGACQIKRRET